MYRLAIALACGAVLAGCATEPASQVTRNDDAYVPIGSNIPRRDRKPEDVAAQQMPRGPYIPSTSAPSK